MGFLHSSTLGVGKLYGKLWFLLLLVLQTREKTLKAKLIKKWKKIKLKSCSLEKKQTLSLNFGLCHFHCLYFREMGLTNDQNYQYLIEGQFYGQHQHCCNLNQRNHWQKQSIRSYFWVRYTGILKHLKKRWVNLRIHRGHILFLYNTSFPPVLFLAKEMKILGRRGLGKSASRCMHNSFSPQ